MGRYDYLESGTSGVAGPTLKYDQPKVSTTSGATGISTRPVGTNASPITAPSFNYYSAPAPAPQPAVAPSTFYNPGYQTNQSTAYAGAGGGGGGGTAAVEAPPRPVMPDYNSWTEDQVAAADSPFMDQRTMYQNKLQKYIADYESQAGNNAYGQDYNGADFLSKWSAGSGGGRMGQDYRMASQGVGRNREMGLTNVAEDFASRGMANSGLYADNFQKAIEGYNRQKQGLDSATSGGLQDLSFKRGNFEGDTQAGVQSARRDAIGRLMQNFNLQNGG